MLHAWPVEQSHSVWQNDSSGMVQPTRFLIGLPERGAPGEIKQAVLPWLACPPKLGAVYRVYVGSPLQLQDFLMQVVGLDAACVTARDIRCSASSVNAAQYTLVMTHRDWYGLVQRSMILRQSCVDLI